MEFVLVVPRRDLFVEPAPQGFVAFGPRCTERSFEDTVREHGYFVERERAERDPALKQVIPYTIVTRRGTAGHEVLLLRRLARGGEKRLHDKLSIGVGGHLDPVDAEGDRDRLLDAGTRRELTEELTLEGALSWSRVGLLNDDSNSVGQVHVGLVQVARVEGRVGIREEDVLSGDFTTPARLAQLLAEKANFETWSALLLDRLAEWSHEADAAHAHRLETLDAPA